MLRKPSSYEDCSTMSQQYCWTCHSSTAKFQRHPLLPSQTLIPSISFSKSDWIHLEPFEFPEQELSKRMEQFTQAKTADLSDTSLSKVTDCLLVSSFVGLHIIHIGLPVSIRMHNQEYWFSQWQTTIPLLYFQFPRENKKSKYADISISNNSHSSVWIIHEDGVTNLMQPPSSRHHPILNCGSISLTRQLDHVPSSAKHPHEQPIYQKSSLNFKTKRLAHVQDNWVTDTFDTLTFLIGLSKVVINGPEIW
jgi:hypothetical protein